MSLLQLSDDDIALLRWTCELFFVPESPLYFIDAEAREPADFAGTHAELVRKGVLDDANFRLTDMALNRLAPLSECDARVMLQLPGERGKSKARDFYLVDEIAVEYEDVEDGHLVGADQDHQELIVSLAKRFMPRRSAGDYLHLKLSPSEFVALTVLCHKARQGNVAVTAESIITELRPALVDTRVESLAMARRRHHREGAMQDGAALRHRAATLLATPAHEPSPVQDITARASQPVAAPDATQPLRARPASMARLPTLGDDEQTAVDRAVPPRKANGAPDAAELALRGLIDKGVVLQTERGMELRPAVQSFAGGVSAKQRHTFTRFDFSDDEWIVRETSFLATDGSLYVLSAEEGGGQLAIVELDGKRLEGWLGRAVGPLPELSPEDAPGKSAKDFLLRA